MPISVSPEGLCAAQRGPLSAVGRDVASGVLGSPMRLAAEDELPDPMAGLQPPRVTGKLVPVFTGEELARLEQACAGRTFAQRRDTAIIAVFKATGIRLAELAGLQYDPGDPRRSDIDLWQREITVRGKCSPGTASGAGQVK